MRRVIIFLVIASIAPCVWAEIIPLEEILKNSQKYDKKMVEFRGEVVGDILKGKDGFWINVVDSGVGIGVFAKNLTLFKKINHFGSYKEKGDVVEIKGIFFKTCPKHYTTDVHLKTLRIYQPGYRKVEEVPLYKLKLLLFLGIICLTLSALYFIKFKIWKK